MGADLLDRLLVTLAVRLRSFSVCTIQRGWRLGFSPFEAITVHYVLRGTGSLRVGQGPWRSFAPHTIIVVPARHPHSLGAAEDCVGEVRAEDHCFLHGDGLIAFTAGDGSPDAFFVCGQISKSRLESDLRQRRNPQSLNPHHTLEHVGHGAAAAGHRDYY